MTVPDTVRVLLTYEEPITETSFFGMWRCYIDKISGWHAYSAKLMDCCRDAGVAIDRLADKGTVPRGPQGDTIEPVTDGTVLGRGVANITLQKKGSRWEATSDLDPRWIGQAVDARHAMTEAASIIRAQREVKDPLEPVPPKRQPTPKREPQVGAAKIGRPRALTLTERAAVLERSAAGESVDVLARVFGVHRNSITAVTSEAKKQPAPQITEPPNESRQDPHVPDPVEETFLTMIAHQEAEERRLRQEVERGKTELAEAIRLTHNIKDTFRAYREKYKKSPLADAAVGSSGDREEGGTQIEQG